MLEEIASDHRLLCEAYKPCQGHWIEDDGGVGSILRDTQGKAIAAFAHHIQHATSTKHVELEVIHTALQWIQKNGLHQCRTELHVEDYFSMEHANLIDDIHRLQQQTDYVAVVFVPRTVNAVAHRLVN
ncbi:hypothetical protein ACLB2K_063581 [Fragaria x ananassa]